MSKDIDPNVQRQTNYRKIASYVRLFFTVILYIVYRKNVESRYYRRCGLLL